MLSFAQKVKSELPEGSIGDLIPDKMYDKQAILTYLKMSREKCERLIYSLNDETIKQRFNEGDEPGDMDYPILEIILYNLRHTQHHTAQLNLLMRQDLDKHMTWLFRVGDILNDA